MTPLYFPFTCAGDETAARLGRWFDRVTLLIPSSDLASECLGPQADPGFWQVIPPAGDDETALALLEADLRRWAEVHAGSDLAAVLADRDEESPFSAVPPVNRLRNRIQAGAGNRQPAAPVPDPLLTAKVFLRLAHGLDRDRAAIRTHLRDLSGIEREMLLELQGQPEEDAASTFATQGAEDPGAFLTERRLAAWARLALAAGVPSDVWVTDSSAVMEALADIAGALHPVWTPEKAAVPELNRSGGQDLLNEVLAGARSSRNPVSADRTDLGFPPGTAIAVYAADMTPVELCRRMATGAVNDHDAPPEERCLVVWVGAGEISANEATALTEPNRTE